MQFKNAKSVQAPLEDVWNRLADFSAWERMIMQSGGTMRPKVTPPEPGVGQAWDMEFPFRGKRRKAVLSVVEFAPQEALGLDFKGTMLSAITRLTLRKEPSGRTMMECDINAKPINMTGRLLLQTARLMRPRVVGAIDARLSRLASEIEYHS